MSSVFCVESCFIPSKNAPISFDKIYVYIINLSKNLKRSFVIVSSFEFYLHKNQFSFNLIVILKGNILSVNQSNNFD